MGLLNPMRIHESQEVVGKLPNGKRGLTPGRFSMPARVNGYHAKMLGKQLHLVDKITDVFPISMKKDKRETRPLLNIIVLNIH